MIQNNALPWRPSPLIKFTLLLHAGMLIALFLFPRAWAEMLAILCINHLIMLVAGMWPRSSWLGQNMTRLPQASAARREIALTIDDGPHPEVTPQVLELLDRHGIKASFFCVGEKAARHPDICKSIVDRGHAIENHTQQHAYHFALLGPWALKREIQAAQQTLGTITGRNPIFFRAPAGLRNPFLDPVLASLGLRLAAWSRRGFDTRISDPAVVSRRLLKDLQAGSILLLHDGNSARSASGVPVIVAVLPVLLEAAAVAGLHFVTLDQAVRTEIL